MEGGRNERRSRHLLGCAASCVIIPALVEVSQTILERVALDCLRTRGFIGIVVFIILAIVLALLVFLFIYLFIPLCRAYIFFLFFSPLLVILGRLTSQTRHIGDNLSYAHHTYPRRSWMVSGC